MPTAASLPQAAHPEVAGDSEFARVLRICNPGAALDGPLTFCPGSRQTAKTWLAAWQLWRETIFEPALAPALAEAAGHAMHEHAREMIAVDAGLGTRLAPDVAVRSVAAGRRLLHQLCRARGARWLGKLAEQAARDCGAGHFAVVYAGQSAFFHLPLRVLLPTYAYWEWSAAMAVCTFHGSKPDFAVEAAEWQRIEEAALGPTLFNPVEPLPNAGRAF